MTIQRHHSVSRALASGAVAALLCLVPATSVQAMELGETCTNPEVRYTVGYPTGWYANDRVEGGDLDDVSACRFFSPQDFEVRPQSEATGIAIVIGVGSQGPPGLLTPHTEVGGKPAFITETETPEDGLEPAGTHHYDYWVELGPDTWLRAGTSDGPNFVGDYAANKSVLDAMMESLRFGGDRLPDTAAAPARVPSLFIGTGLLLTSIALAAARWLRTIAPGELGSLHLRQRWDVAPRSLMRLAIVRRLAIVAAALAALAGSAGPAAAHNGALVFTGRWDDTGCYEFPEDDMLICQDISGLVHITISPSGVLSFSDQTGGHFTISVDGTVIQDEEFDSHTHSLVARGDAQEQTVVYLFDGTYHGLACDGRWIYTIADGELRFDHYVNDCAPPPNS